MKKKTCLLICSNYYQELKAVLDQENLDDFSVISFKHNCAKFGQASDSDIESILEENKNLYSRFHLICSKGCMDNGNINRNLAEFDISETKLCFEFLLNKSIIDLYSDQGTYIMSPGWLNKWEHYVIDTWKFDKDLAKDFFRESASELLLLDTGVHKDSLCKLKEFSEYVGRPFNFLPVGLDYFTLFIKNIILKLNTKELKLENQRKKKMYKTNNNKLSDYIMVFDFLKTLNEINKENILVDRIIDLIKMIFSPNKVMFLTVKDNGEVNTCTCFQNCFDKSELMNFYENKKDEIYQWTKSGKGFCVKIKYNDKVKGLLLVDDLTFPEYKKSYLSTLLDISPMLGLSIHQIRTNSKILESKNMLIAEKTYLNQLFEGSPESILLLDENLNIKNANKSFLKLFKLQKKDFTGFKIQDFLLNLGTSENCVTFIDKLKNNEVAKFETEIRNKAIDTKYFQILGYSVKISDEIRGYYILLSDVSDNKNKENKIKNVAYLDHLTGLKNRRAFEITVKDLINRCKLNKEKFALFILDLNKFKEINDTFSHQAGDNALIKTALKLKECLRDSDEVFRLGGDEFAVLMPLGFRSDHVKNTAERISNSANIKFSFEGSEVKVSTSIGFTIFPDDGVDEKTLYIKADKLMYHSKHQNR